MSDLLTLVPMDQIVQWVRRSSSDRRYKGQPIVLHLKNGGLVQGNYERYDDVTQAIVLLQKEPSASDHHLVIPRESIIFFKVGPSLSHKPSDHYAFGGMSYTLADFPRPFVSSDGAMDLLFVIGEGSRDYTDHNDFLKRKGEFTLNSANVGRRGDFDYLLSLATALGFHSGKISAQQDLSFTPRAKQGLQIGDIDHTHNIISIGSGAVNTFTKRVLEAYGDDLPVRFTAPNSDEELLDQVTNERKTYSRRKEGEKDVGVIELLPNPWNPSKVILIVAGLTVSGTQAALLALSRNVSRRLHNRAKKTNGVLLEIPALLVKAKNVSYINGLENVDDYEFIA
jgi:hypothetical protein